MNRLSTSVRSAPALALALAFLTAPLAASDMGARMAANLADVEGKLVGLAEAIPDAKFGWSPADKVRTVSEVLMHVASANHFFAGRLGAGEPPAESRGWEQTVTTKAAAIPKLQESFAAVKRALESADLGKATKLFGGKEGTLADFGLIAVGHGHEHLGQLIAYARSNGVTPPWSE